MKYLDDRAKLKVLVEDIQQKRKVWLDRLTPGQFGALVGVAAVFAFAITTTAAVYVNL